MSAFSAAASDEDGDTIHTLRAAIQQAIDWIAEKPDLRPTSAGRMVGVLQTMMANVMVGAPQPDTGIPASVPPGWKLVPTRITSEMYDAWADDDGDQQTAWRSMLAAAPQPPLVEKEPIGEAHLLNASSEAFTHCVWDSRVVPVGTKLYTHPQHRQPLTTEMADLGWELHGSSDAYQAWYLAIEWTERTHGIGGAA